MDRSFPTMVWTEPGRSRMNNMAVTVAGGDPARRQRIACVLQGDKICQVI